MTVPDAAGVNNSETIETDNVILAIGHSSRDTLEMIYGKNIYSAPWNMDYINKMKPEITERVFRERYGNPADVTFVFVGDFNEKELVDLCSYYIGTLKTDDSREETKYVYFPFPKTSKTETVKNSPLDLLILPGSSFK